jgi:hypothetical protein
MINDLSTITHFDLWVKDLPFNGYRSIGSPSDYRHVLSENESERLISEVLLWEDQSHTYWHHDHDPIKTPCIAGLGTRTGQLFGWFVIEFAELSQARQQVNPLLDVILIAGYAYERMLLFSILRVLSNGGILAGQAQHLDAVSAISAYVSQLSHQLRNPMTAIRGYSDLLTSGLMGQITAQQAQSLETIIYNLDRVNEGVLIPNSIFKLYANRLDTQKQVEDIREILLRIRDHFQKTKLRSQVRMICDLPDHLMFQTDPQFFEEAIRGILKTCMHFMVVDQDCLIKGFLCGEELFVLIQCQMDFMKKITAIKDFDHLISSLLLEGNYQEVYALWKKSSLLWGFIGGEIVSAEYRHSLLRLTLRLHP